MKTIEFDPNGERLTASFTFDDLIVASYSFTLWEANSNDRVKYEEGNNQNIDDDSFKLPLPVSTNHGRLLQLRTEFVGLDQSSGRSYEIKAQIHQGGKLLGELSDSGKITGGFQASLIYIIIKHKN
ncbi:MAG TPA: hypothetical protein PKD94_02065 [Ignavibacteria bacterium]|nr:hypothetical protein [Ignavibacteria bacterium]